ncbi:T9SS type A sorting domain-containing protein [Pedobacter sp. SD-b]|uniref:T9SS type A sorting domain-containing protein n=2 Tax=Pedobacter segetis TaxID=2793069 RepID=A0ABS1BMS2_9SPHI|nr:T9SS type A sorting domain-containing protein [Pedobacter segetis]
MAALFAVCCSNTNAQTVVYQEGFGSAAVAEGSYSGGTSTVPGSPSQATYTTQATKIASIVADAETSGNYVISYGTQGSNSKDGIMTSFSKVNPNYKTTLSDNTGNVTFTINMRAFGQLTTYNTSGGKGMMFVIGSNVEDVFTTSTSGYAILFQKSTTSNTNNEVRFVSFSNGVFNNTVFVDLASSGPLASTTNSISVKLVYRPNDPTNNWQFNVKQNSSAAFEDPETVDYSMGGVTATFNDNTYTGTPLLGFGLLATRQNNASAVVINADNLKIATDATLPIKLTSFTGNYLNNGVNLKWETASELNTDKFEIERLEDGSFKFLGTVKASGNSSSSKTYSYIDRNPLSGTNYYRLKTIDKDGSFEYNKEIAVNIKDLSQTNAISYPNPATTSLNIAVPSNFVGSFKVTLTNLNGQKVKELDTNSFSYHLDVTTFKRGIYILTIADSKGNKSSKEVQLK